MFLCYPRLRILQRRTVWCPTYLGWFSIVVLLMIPLIWWYNCGESFLSLTRRLPADVLVVEGWIGRAGICAAAAEFEQRGYKYVVASGGEVTAGGWEQGGWSYAEAAERELIRLGIPKNRIIVAGTGDAETQRTYESASAVWRALEAREIHTTALNVFTLGPHARRSRLVFAKVLGPAMQVGVIGWTPSSYEGLPWWRSSGRARELLAETAGYLYEALLNSGRSSNSPDQGASPDFAQHSAFATKAFAR
jgi:uncharacterized SAM-binding protein YcdF (DUF218 family)